MGAAQPTGSARNADDHGGAGWVGPILKREEYIVRHPNFKLDWFVPNQVVGLTHFHSNVTSDDIMKLIKKGHEITSNVEEEFHLIMDNRVVNMPSLLSLDQMKQMVPYMNHPLLRWIIVIKPEGMTLDTAGLPIEKKGKTHLKTVSGLAEALSFLREKALNIQWENADVNFFHRKD